MAYRPLPPITPISACADRFSAKRPPTRACAQSGQTRDYTGRESADREVASLYHEGHEVSREEEHRDGILRSGPRWERRYNLEHEASCHRLRVVSTVRLELRARETGGQTRRQILER